ncbi:response regulator [Haliangium ochraceum]|uniref:Response regulator receiver protein n=1 Tax=Haliangium ochraceum (strain DSM 14365 / JCM 11303 / SMP-2) TaxID=502025 RepID=D0LSQ9_HALO1|nr:response regulator [Haliangium ochraceum]ACY17281.1 response regulator receiver protein [Haliangium ochraceum DSM 14365]
MPKLGQALDILLVEDNPADVDLTLEAFEQSGVRGTLHVATDGVDALRFLRREGEYAEAPRPAMVLLDLNLPRKDGREVLTEIKQDQGLRNIPVVILSSSASDDDVLASYRLHANSYIQKPSSFARYIEVVRALDVFWFQVVTFPPAV